MAKSKQPAPRAPIQDGLAREDFTEERFQKLIKESNLGKHMRFLSVEDREISRKATLARLGKSESLWVFAVGSLMWNPAMITAERRGGKIHGWHRKYCLWVLGGRGTPENPGLMLGLVKGGSCRGIVWRIAPKHIENESQILWRREMLGEGYRPKWVSVDTDGGKVEAIAFAANTDHERYAGDVTEDQIVHSLATAEGILGTSCAYLHNTVFHLDELGIGDGPMHRLLARVDAYRQEKE